MGKQKTCRLRAGEAEREERFRTQISETVQTLERELVRDPASPRALRLAAVLADLSAGEVPLPPAVAAAAKSAEARRPPDEALITLLWSTWDGFESEGFLTAARAEALARPLIQGLRDPLHVLRLKRKAARYRERLPESLFDRAIGAIDPGYLGALPTLKIDRAFLKALLSRGEAARIKATFHPGGHLRRLASLRGKANLELDPLPGSGRFVQEGKRGGYGFLTSEHYRNGGISGTFNSPWHDGEEYSEKIDWPLWVSEAARSVVTA